MKLPTSFFLFVFLTAPAIAETAQDGYTAKLEALKELGGQARAAVNPSNNIVFPQIANGSSQGIIIISSVVLSNNTANFLPVTLTFTGQFGGPMVLSLIDSATGAFVGTGNIFSLLIPPFETLFLETNGAGGLIEGWARATSFGASDMGGVAAFQLIDAATLRFITVVGVGASSASGAFFAPVVKVDSSPSSSTNTAFAFANTSNQTAYLEVFLFENNGPGRSTILSIGPQERIAVFINELFSMGSEFFGTAHFLRVDSAGEVLIAFDIHPVVLLLSNGILSSLPVTNIFPL